jgi:hypothetical protein
MGWIVSNQDSKYFGMYVKGAEYEALGMVYGKIYASPIGNKNNYHYSGWIDSTDLEKAGPSILEKKKVPNLHEETTTFTKEEVQITGCKSACSSVWCKECFKRRGGSKRIAERLSELTHEKTRHVILTTDLEKFNGCPQTAYETIREKEGISQFIHNLKRSGGKAVDWDNENQKRIEQGKKPYTEEQKYSDGVPISDWVAVLEWHKSGAPHWHTFLQVEKEGKAGMIGNPILLHHWKYGLVREEYIRSAAHWKRFTDYFGNNGYFDSKHSSEKKDKGHQLELPEWAMNVNYRIRKMSAMKKKKEIEKNGNIENSYVEDKIDIDEEEIKDPKEKEQKTYREILQSCGETTYCQIRRGDNNIVWDKLNIPYRLFIQYPGEYIQKVGYRIQMDLNAFFLFMALYDNDKNFRN